MTRLLLIALGGAAGTLARHGVNVALAERLGLAFPFGTLTVNTLGCLLLGFLSALFPAVPWASEEVRLMLATGLCGGFTTYSSFNLELLKLLQAGGLGRAGLYFVATVALCAGAGVLGLWLGRLTTT